jgi:hypothetical protein
MFALIIAIIAIALTVYLAVSTLFYGGDALSNGSARAIASAFINQGQQINGAHTLYKNDNAGMSVADTAGLTVLVDQNYLSSLPVPQAGGDWEVDASFDHDANATTAGIKVVKSVGVETTAPIAEEICDLVAEKASAGSATFGCVEGATPANGANTVWYRM